MYILRLYRQEQIWQRFGIATPRNASCGWLMKAAECCEPLCELLRKHAYIRQFSKEFMPTLKLAKNAVRYYAALAERYFKLAIRT